MWFALCRWILSLSPEAYRARYGTEILADLARRYQSEFSGLARQRWQLAAAFDLGRTVWRERRAGRSPILADLTGDLRYAWRGWRRNPAYGLTVVVTMAVGLGLVAAIFAFADGYLFRPLPFPGGDRVYRVSDPKAQIAAALKATDVVALKETDVRRYGFVEWNTRDTGELVIGGRKVSVLAYEISPGFRETVGLPLLAGRDFAAEDHHPESARVAWLSHRFWRREFGGDPGVIGRRVPFESFETSAWDSDVTVVGILAPAFTTLDLNNPPPALVLPARGNRPIRPTTLSFPLIRIPDNETTAFVEARIAAALQSVAPAGDGDTRSVRLISLRETQIRSGRPTATVLLGGALLVMVLAVSSLLHLLLGRSAARQGEFAIRLSLGASRWRVVRVLLVESVWLGGTGIIAGLWFGKVLAGLIATRIPQLPSGGRSLALVPMLYDWRVVTAAAILGGALVLLGGVWPAWRVIRWSSSPGRVPRGTFRGILVSEAAVATIVLAGAATIGLGIYRYLHQPLGFDYQDRYAVVPWSPDGPAVRGVQAQTALDAVRSVEGVHRASLSTSAGGFVAEAAGAAVDVSRIQVLAAPDGWMQTWGIGLWEGRFFAPEEFVPRAEAAIVNETFAATVWPGRSAIGLPLVAGGAPRTVVGVIATPRWRLSGDPSPEVYVPAYQAGLRGPIIAWVREPLATQLEAGEVTPLTGPIVAAIPGATIDVRARTFDDLFMRDIGEPRFQTPIVTAFGVLAIALAGIGIFGLVSYLVAQRGREFAVRAAIGASRTQIWRSVIAEAIWPAAVGVAVGLTAAAWLERFVEGTIFGSVRSGIPVLVAVGGLVLFIAAIATFIPASRAARVDPAQALRLE